MQGPVGREFPLEKILFAPAAIVQGQKPFVVRTQEGHIQIVVPGDEAPVPGRPQGGARKEDIGNIVGRADPVQLPKQLQQHRLMLLQRGHRLPSPENKSKIFS